MSIYILTIMQNTQQSHKICAYIYWLSCRTHNSHVRYVHTYTVMQNTNSHVRYVRIYTDCHAEHTTVMIYAWLNSPWLLLSKTHLGWIILKLVTVFTVFMKIKCLNMFHLPRINQIRFQPVYHTVYTSPTCWLNTHHVTVSSFTPQRTKWY